MYNATLEFFNFSITENLLFYHLKIFDMKQNTGYLYFDFLK